MSQDLETETVPLVRCLGGYKGLLNKEEWFVKPTYFMGTFESFFQRRGHMQVFTGMLIKIFKGLLKECFLQMVAYGKDRWVV